MTEAEVDRAFIPESLPKQEGATPAFLTSEIKGKEKYYTMATPDGDVIKLNTLRVTKEQPGFEVEEPPTIVYKAGIWGDATHISQIAALARFGEVVGIAQPEGRESEIPFRRIKNPFRKINKKDFDNFSFAELWLMEKMGLKDVVYWGISEGAATGIAAAARDAREVTEGKHKSLIETLVLVAPSGMMKECPLKLILNFAKSVAADFDKEKRDVIEKAVNKGLSEEASEQAVEEAVEELWKIAASYPQVPPEGWRGKVPPFDKEKLLNWLWNGWLLSRGVVADACKEVKCNVVYVAGEEDLIAQPEKYRKDTDKSNGFLAGLKERFPNAQSVKVITVPGKGHGLPIADADLLSFAVMSKILSLKPIKSETPGPKEV